MPSLIDSLSFEQQLDLLANQLSGSHGVQLTYQHGHWTVFIGHIEILYDDCWSETIDEEDIPISASQEEAVRKLLQRLIEVPVNSAVFRVFAPDSWHVTEPQSVTRFDGTNFVEVSLEARLWLFPRGYREIPIHSR